MKRPAMFCFAVAATSTLSACCRLPTAARDTGVADGAPVSPAPTATAASFPPDARFLSVPAAERTLRVVTKGAVAVDVTTPAASLSEDHWERFGEGAFRVFGINNHQGVGGWAVAGFTGAGEFPLTGEGGKVSVDVELTARGESVGEHKLLRDGKLRVEHFSTVGGKARLRATAFGTVKTDSGKVLPIQIAFHVVVPSSS